MSRSTDRTGYDLPPVNTLKALHISEPRQSLSSMEEKSEHLQRESRHLIRHWRWEIFTFLLGTGAFATILILFLQFRNKPLPPIRLGENNIQLTAIIAALAQVAQSALLVPISYCIGQLKWKWFQSSKQTVDLDRFDLASRGPDGSIRLLFFLCWRQRLVSLGALATVLMLLFPTFVQQSVQVGTKDVLTYNSSRALIARSTNVFNGMEDKSAPFTRTLNAAISPYGDQNDLSTALKSGIFRYVKLSLHNRASSSDIQGYCGGHPNTECSWPPFNTLALCYSTSNISGQIIRNGDHVSLPILQDFLEKGKDTPTFQSGTYIYTAQGQPTAAFMPRTSASNETNLPSLAEIYYLYYDACIDPDSEFNKKDPKRWSALQGRFQFCIQRCTSQTDKSGFTSTKVIESKTNLDWHKTTKYNESAFCTRLESEKEDFCVAESVMESLSRQMSVIFNATAFFSNNNRIDGKYSSEWGSHLTRAVCGSVNDKYYDGEYGFSIMLAGIVRSLSDSFRGRSHQTEDVYGTLIVHNTVLLVDFRWFILPAVLYTIVAIFFVATIVTTRNTPMWKSSPLVLLHAMKEEGGVGTEDRIREEAKKSRMRLSQVATGWQLVEGTKAQKLGNQYRWGGVIKTKSKSGTTSGMKGLKLLLTSDTTKALENMRQKG